ncbi:MAG: polysaccharide deacetylase family protein [Bacteroidales bacterium]|nr:polysaccharide deacetylase family protein [Bacteroidales bacterium]
MITFHRFNLLFFIMLLMLNILGLLFGKTTTGFIQTHATLFYIILFGIYFGIVIAMAFFPCTNFYHPVLCSSKTDENSVSITFDDGPDPVKTPLILKALKKHGASAAFFCIGKNIAGNEHLLKQMSEEGHLIGNHSFSHSNLFDLFSVKRMRQELVKTDSLISKITGKSPLFFRPPFGVINPLVSITLKKFPMQVICWNIRSLDTLKLDPVKTKNKILRQLQPGAIILLHDHTEFTEHHLDGLLSEIRDAGYNIILLDKLLKLPAYAI